MPTADELGAYYASQYTGEHGQDAVQQDLVDYYLSHAHELAGVLRVPPRDLSIVDVGCSYPVFLEQARKAGYRRVLGVDYSSEAAAYGAARGVDVVAPEAFAELPDRSFDILRYSHALEHMISPAVTLGAQIQKLRIGGLLYVTQPNFPTFKAAPGQELKDSVWPTHLHYFNPVSLSRMVEDAGAEIIRFFTVGEAEAAAERYGLTMDTDYGRRSYARLAELGEPSRGVLNNFPAYTGENSGLMALRVR
jgi:SAM-dependent methyltransferase